MKICRFLIALLICHAALANDMGSAFNEGKEVGKGNNGNTQEIIKSFNPGQFEGYQARPQESQYYGGVRGNNPNLMSDGMNALTNSESGKAITNSVINNPKMKISQESDFIQSSERIRKNAASISGTKDGQCVSKILNKTSFTYHFCEKEQSISHVCSKTAKIKWDGNRKIEIKEQTIKWDEIVYKNWYEGEIISPYSGDISEFEIKFRWFGGWHGNFLLNFVKVDFLGKTSNQNFARNVSWKVVGLKANVEKGQKIPILFTNRVGLYRKNIDYIKLVYEVESNSIRPEIEWESVCPINPQDSEIIRSEEICTQPGGERVFEREGQRFVLNSDCWQYQQKFIIHEASDNECKTYEDNANCTVGERECILQENGNCVRHRVKYQCQTTSQTDGKVCGDKFFCSDGSCSKLEGSENKDFGHAVSQLASVAQAGKDIGLDPQNMKAFSGKPMFCRKSGFGFSDCCKDSGWGNKAGLAKCNSEENALGKAKEKKLVVYVGTFCDKKVLKKCIRRKSGYCVFDNKLARIIQYQGRSGQLGIGFGGANNPDCRGLSVEELQRLDFNAMDYSDFYEELNERTNIPDKQQLMDHMRNSIIEQLQDVK